MSIHPIIPGRLYCVHYRGRKFVMQAAYEFSALIVFLAMLHRGEIVV